MNKDAYGALDLREKMTQVFGYWHALEGTNTRPPCVAMGNPKPGEQSRCKHARELADDLPVVAPAQACHQHQPVNLGMPERHPLSQYMCPLQVNEGDLREAL